MSGKVSGKMSGKASGKVSGKTSGRKAKSSPKPPRKSPRKTDRRVTRTRDVLGDALVGLMHEKPFDAITVQHVLDRAGVSRSTFYTHYRDKDDLFLSDVEDFLDRTAFYLSRKGESSNRVAAVRELFSHIAEWREFHTALVSAGKIRDFFEMAEGFYARGIDQRLSELPASRALPPARRTVLAQMFAGSLISLLSWWINRTNPESPAEMDALYHRMVWSGVGSSSA